MRIDGFAHGLFVIAMASIAILGFHYGSFVPIGAAFPAWIPARSLWIYGSAILLFVASIGLVVPRVALMSAAVLAVYQAVWALISVLPVVSDPHSVTAWYGFCESLSPLVGAWILYAMLRWQSRRSQTAITSEHAVRVAQVLFGLTCVFYGWSHFKYADYTASMVPVWLPGRLGFAYLTGAGHVAAGIALVVGLLPRLAATLEALMMSLFGLAVWVPSFYMHPKPDWAMPTPNEWSELVVTLMLAATAWMVATSLRYRRWLR